MTDQNGARNPSLRRIFAVPLTLGIATGVGLVAALLGDGVGRIIAWVGVGAPIIVFAWYALRPAGDA